VAKAEVRELRREKLEALERQYFPGEPGDYDHGLVVEMSKRMAAWEAQAQVSGGLGNQHWVECYCRVNESNI
jgi:hypothetical protein